MSTEPTILLQDLKVFESAFKTHYSSLASFAYQYVGEREAAEEIVQEMFTSLWEKAEKTQIQTNLKSYLFGATRNACLNYLKHQKVKQKYVDRQMWSATEASQVDFLELEQLQNLLEKAMNKIPEKCREIFELSRFEGKKYQEIADELNLSLKTVENQMGKALKILREELHDYLPLIIFWISVMGVKSNLVVGMI